MNVSGTGTAARRTLERPVEIRRLGRVEYRDGLAMQEALAAAVHAGNSPDTFLLLEHGPVLTLGRGATAENVLASPEVLAARDVELFETTRGGDVTFHGPGQIVGYPIFNLAREKETKDVRRFVRALEELMIRACADYGIRAERVDGLTGVWAGRDKVGAIGVRVSKWVTSHGFALNVATDLSWFDLIVPCGIPDRGVTSISRLAGKEVPREEVEDALERHASEIFGRDLARRDVAQTTIAVVLRRGHAEAARFLCLKRIPARGGFWQIVTGRMERGETPAVAAARELREETGLALPVRALEYEHAFALELPGAAPGATPTLGREVVFVADCPEGSTSTVAPDEHDEHRWLPLTDARALVRHAGHRRALALAARPD